MKLILILTILLLSVTQTDRPTYFDCVVTKVGDTYTVKCDTPNTSALCRLPKNQNLEVCQNTILDIPKENWNEFPDWHFVSGDYPEPVKTLAVPQLGQILKATITEDGLLPLKPCNARAHEALKNYCRDNHYCRPPNALYTPYGCGWEQSKYIKDQLAQLKQK